MLWAFLGFAGDAGSACAGEEPGVELGGKGGATALSLVAERLRLTGLSAEMSLLLLLIITVVLLLAHSGWGHFERPLMGLGILNAVPGRSGKGLPQFFAAQNYFSISSTGWQSLEQPKRLNFPLQGG